jgi:hypothetical protein
MRSILKPSTQKVYVSFSNDFFSGIRAELFTTPGIRRTGPVQAAVLALPPVQAGVHQDTKIAIIRAVAEAAQIYQVTQAVQIVQVTNSVT